METKTGRLMWLSPTGGTATVPGALHDEESLKKANYRPVYVHTPEELTRLIQECWEEALLNEGVSMDDWKRFSDFLAQRGIGGSDG